MTTGTWFIS